MNEIIIKNFTDPSLLIGSEFLVLKEAALDSSRKITTVASAPMKDIAVECLVELKRLLKGVESARVEVKKPIDAVAKKIQNIAKTACEGLDAEAERLGFVIGSYEAEERRLIAEEELKRQAEIRAESERMAKAAEESRLAALAVTKAKTEEERLIAEKALQVASQAEMKAADIIRESKPIVANGSKGVRFLKTPMWEVTDLKKAFAAQPDLFEIVPIAAKCKAASGAGLKIEGFRFWIEERVA